MSEEDLKRAKDLAETYLQEYKEKARLSIGGWMVVGCCDEGDAIVSVSMRIASAIYRKYDDIYSLSDALETHLKNLTKI